jgi:hypothetical protein
VSSEAVCVLVLVSGGGRFPGAAAVLTWVVGWTVRAVVRRGRCGIRAAPGCGRRGERGSFFSGWTVEWRQAVRRRMYGWIVSSSSGTGRVTEVARNIPGGVFSACEDILAGCTGIRVGRDLLEYESSEEFLRLLFPRDSIRT